MIVVVAQLRIKSGFQEEIKKLAQVAVEATRKEQGCIAYRFLQNPYDTCEFCFVEEWRDQDALKAHRLQAHFLKWREESAHIVEGRKVGRYDAREINV